VIGRARMKHLRQFLTCDPLGIGLLPHGVLLSLLLAIHPGPSLADASGAKSGPVRSVLSYLFLPHDPYFSDKLDMDSMLPEKIGFLAVERVWTGIDCAFATFRKPERASIPEDVFKSLADPSIAHSFWENGQVFRQIAYTPFLPTPVPDEVTMGMSKESWTYGLGPKCSADIPIEVKNAWFARAQKPGWYYSFGRKGEFMILLDGKLEHGMLAFTD